MNNDIKISRVIEDKELLRELKISEKDVFKAIKCGIEQIDELQKIIDEEKEKGTSFQELSHKLKGQNENFNEDGIYSHNYFDLNYESLLVTIYQNTQENRFEVDKSDVYIYPDNISKVSTEELFVLDLRKPINIEKFQEYITEDIEKVLLKNYYSDIKDISNIYIIAYALNTKSNFANKYIRKGKLTEENFQKVFKEGKDIFNTKECSEFKIAMFNGENNQFICEYSFDGYNFEKQISNNIFEAPKLVSCLTDNELLNKRRNKEKFCTKQIIDKCLLNDYKSINEIPDIEIHTKISSNKYIQEKEVEFEDGILIQNGVINALTTLDAGQIEKNFGLKELNYDEDYYDAYLDYDSKNDSCEITIVAVTDDSRHYYTYLPKSEEKEMLRKSLEEYVKSIEGKNLKDLFEEIEEIEQE